MSRLWISMGSVVIVVVSLSLAAQAPPGQEKWTPPLTPWGEPDLQGIWNNATSTPLERPEDMVNLLIGARSREAGRDTRDPVTHVSRVAFYFAGRSAP